MRGNSKRPQSKRLVHYLQGGNSNCRQRGNLIVANHRTPTTQSQRGHTSWPITAITPTRAHSQHHGASVGHAITTAPNNSTIVIRSGTYREGSLTVGNGLTLQPYPHEQAWLKASLVITNWTATGSIWMSTGWTHQCVNDTTPAAINPSYPLAGHRDMVFVDGVALTLVASQSAVGPGTFYVDYTRNILYIGNNFNICSAHPARITRCKFLQLLRYLCQLMYLTTVKQVLRNSFDLNYLRKMCGTWVPMATS